MKTGLKVPVRHIAHGQRVIVFNSSLLLTASGNGLYSRSSKKLYFITHMRSASRLGYWDLGKNRSRMEDIRRGLAEAEAKP
jgi:uncharacterized protein (DUF1499 family)